MAREAMTEVRFDEIHDEAAQRFHETLSAHGATDLAVYQARAHGRTFRVCLSRDPMGLDDQGVPDLRWHVSVSQVGSNSVPQWRSLVAIVHALRPGVPFIVGIPPESWWMNVHPGVLHAVETRDVNLIAQWRFEAQGHRPT